MYTAENSRSVVCTDSIAFALPEDRERNVLCTAGHTGRSVVEYFRTFRPWGFICSDGGIGKNNSGITALPAIEPDGIAGASVDAMPARVGDGQSTYFDGVISAVNRLVAAKGVRVGQSAREAAMAMRSGVKAWIGHEGGPGKDDAGISGLPLADRFGIPAAAIATMTARVSDGKTLLTGTVSHRNKAAAKLGVRPGQTGEEAARLMLKAPRASRAT